MRSTFFAVLAVCACGPAPRDQFDSNPDPTGDAPGGGGPDADPELEAFVYAHSPSTLFRIDPNTLNITLVGDFDWPGLSDEMTDIAIDKDGRMVGISFDSVYEVDTSTAQARLLSNDLPGEFNGLSFVPAAQLGQSGDDILIGIETDSGNVSRIDPQTGAATLIGAMGSGYVSSGDLVGIAGFGTVATVDGGNGDSLVRLGTGNFGASLVGSTGTTDLWGIGYWKNQVFGFAQTGEFILINVTTGQGTLIADSQIEWWGAAVTTLAPIIE